MMCCSCKLGMILANLVLGSRWFVEEELDAVVAKCNLLVLLIVHFLRPSSAFVSIAIGHSLVQ